VNRLLAVLLILTLGGACAHTQKKSDPESLQPVVENFHKRVRWKDYRVAAQYIVPERRKDFERTLRERKDERDLDVTDYEIEGVQFVEEGARAIVTSRFQWTRLPSVTQQEETVTSEFVYRGGVWMLEKQQGGPFDGDLP
jgi:SOS response regulatory protein OraA/RecX